jgi:23S rRNA pseudouridine2605 synthase
MIARLQKILSAHGVCSRREAESLIEAGRVTVNGAVARAGESADDEKDVVCVDGKAIRARAENIYIMLNKPRGYLSAVKDARSEKTAALLVRECGARVYPAGRLDKDSEGLLLMTNDGELTNHLTHPRFEVSKTYLVSCEGELEPFLERLSAPMEMDGSLTRGAEITLPRPGQARVTLREGRNRQVRRMFEACGLTVKRLQRVEEHGLRLGRLPVGEWRYLTPKELALLKQGRADV